MRRPSLAGVLWVLFWIGVGLYVINNPSQAGGNLHSAFEWAMGAVESIITFAQTAATGG